MIHLFVRKLASKTELLNKIIEFLEIKDSNTIHDLDYLDSAKIGQVQYGIAFGEVCHRLVSDQVNKLWVLPPIEKLVASKENKLTRNKALEQMKEIKEEIKDLKAKEDKRDWWASMSVGDKNICIYTGAKPVVEADIYMSKDEWESLLRIKEAFRADLITIEEIRKEQVDGTK